MWSGRAGFATDRLRLRRSLWVSRVSLYGLSPRILNPTLLRSIRNTFPLLPNIPISILAITPCVRIAVTLIPTIPIYVPAVPIHVLLNATVYDFPASLYAKLADVNVWRADVNVRRADMCVERADVYVERADVCVKRADVYVRRGDVYAAPEDLTASLDNFYCIVKNNRFIFCTLSV